MCICVRLSQGIWRLNVDMVHHHALQVAETVEKQLLLLHRKCVDQHSMMQCMQGKSNHISAPTNRWRCVVPNHKHNVSVRL